MKRRVRVILTYVILGALLNVAVAWGIVLGHGYIDHRVFPPLHTRVVEGDVVAIQRAFGHEIVQPIGPELMRWAGTPAQYHGLVWWPSRAMHRLDHPGASVAIGSGWPRLTLMTTCKGSRFAFENGLVWNPRAVPFFVINDGRRPLPYVFPMWPIWQGMVVNTAFYASAIWCVICGPRTLRAEIRRRRGLCSRCAYPREDHAICPECGTAHKRGMFEPVAHAAPPA